ncbi:hypothetical protein Pmar_PMAR017249, partial [Perkinsus marinus ATCC 50983]
MLVRYAAFLCEANSEKTRKGYAGSTIKKYIGTLLIMNRLHPRARLMTVMEEEIIRLAKQAVDKIKGKAPPQRACTLTAEQ